MTKSTIVCPTKGSIGSKAAEDKAIELAKANNSKLVFAYIIDIKFFEKGFSSQATGRDVEAGLKNIGSVILDIVKEKAVEKGLPDADVFTEERKGEVIPNIRDIVEEYNANLVIVGHPDSDTGFLERHLVEKEGIGNFVRHLKDAIGCEVIMV